MREMDRISFPEAEGGNFKNKIKIPIFKIEVRSGPSTNKLIWCGLILIRY